VLRRCAACFVFCSIFLTTFLFSFFFFYKFNGHLCHGAYWCTHNPAHMPFLLFYLYLHFFNSCVPVCVYKHVYAFPSSSIFIHTYRHIHTYICFDYSVMTPYNVYGPLIQCLCVPAPGDVARCLHTRDPMFKGLYFSNHPCLRFLWMHTFHVHIKKAKLCVYLPLSYVLCSTTSLFASIPST